MCPIFYQIFKICTGRQPVREVFAKLSSESGDVSNFYFYIKLCTGRQPVREVFANDVCEANSQLTLALARLYLQKADLTKSG